MEELQIYPEIEPFNTGELKVSDLHTLHYEEAGNPNGIPAVFLHGGPGAGLNDAYRRFFDPNVYHVILFDQRGSGQSTPHAELKENTTWHLVEDMEKLRTHFGFDKWLVFGGSWGSTLALSYAESHPENVSALVLRGVFLGRKFELDWLYQDEGVARLYPDNYEEFVNFIPENERGDMINAYYKRLIADDEDLQLKAAKIWSIWEAGISKLVPDQNLIEEFGDPHTALSIAKVECHYFVNNLFLETENYLLDNAHKIKDIPAVIVQGRYDVVCPPRSAWDLHKALPKSDLRIMQTSGHSQLEVGISNELVKAADELKTTLQ